MPVATEEAMATLTVTAKGQVTLRKAVLRHLGVAPGQKVEVDLLPNGRVELKAAKSPASIENFFGCLYRPGTKPLTIEEINEIAAQGWAGCR
jgi:antitoxin PrlF